MTVTIPAKIAQSIAELAKASGRTPQDLLIKTLQLHFPPISADLQDEFDAWERASDEDLLKADLLLDTPVE